MTLYRTLLYVIEVHRVIVWGCNYIELVLFLHVLVFVLNVKARLV